MSLQTDLNRALVVVPDFPKKGIQFRDITPVLRDPALFSRVIDCMADLAASSNPTVIGGVDARGFIFASAVAYKLRLPLVLFRKPGKLPNMVHKIEYHCEYSDNSISMQIGDIKSSDNVVVIDDVLATGGTAGAISSLVSFNGAQSSFVFLADIPNLLLDTRVSGRFSSLVTL